MHFEENQLSPRSIGISPLPTVLPSHLQLTPVRSSTSCYTRFDLTMGRSRGFGSNPCHHGPPPKRRRRPIQTRFPSAYGGTPLKRRQRLTRRLILQKARRHAGMASHSIALRLLVGGAVSGTVSPPSRGAFHLSLTVLVHYRSPRNT